MEATGSEKCSTAEQKAEFIANMTCAICLEPPWNYPVTTKCGHIFCEACLYEWLENEVKPCPMCRTLLAFNKLNDMIRPTFIFSRAEDSSSSEDGIIIADTYQDDTLLDDATSPPRPYIDSISTESSNSGELSPILESRTDQSDLTTEGVDGAVTTVNYIDSLATYFENIYADDKTV